MVSRVENEKSFITSGPVVGNQKFMFSGDNAQMYNKRMVKLFPVVGLKYHCSGKLL